MGLVLPFAEVWHSRQSGDPGRAPFLTHKRFMEARYGASLFRIPVDLGARCPHRAADGTGGCSFCPPDGARAVQLDGAGTAAEQVEQAMRFARERYRARRFMLYLQAYSHTLAPGSGQRAGLTALLQRYRFDAISIGMRPDAIDTDVLDFLAKLNQSREVWVELGVQTLDDATLKRIRRGHDRAASLRAMQALHARGLHTVIHVILGLPGESRAACLQTAETLAAYPFEAIKVHNLHVIRDTELARDYQAHPFPLLGESEYAELLIDFLRRIPADAAVMRLMTDTPPDRLIAPHWHLKKGQFLELVERRMRLAGVRQGDLVARGAGRPSGRPADEGSPAPLQPIRTHDGSPTFWSPEFKEHYHSPVGARLEAQWKYVVPSRLGARLAAGPVRLLDVCFGLGYNTLAACARATRQRAHRLEVIALEINRPMVAHAAACATETRPFAWRAALSDLFAKGRLDRKHFRIGMRWGDARDTLRRLRPRTVDIVFLDPFSTQRNSELWTVDCFRMLKAVMAPGGVLLTYSTAVPVLAGLLEAGFHVGQTRPGHGLRNGTLAALRADDIDTPLAPEQLAAIRTTPRGTPYRDPYGCWTNRAILRDREERMALANDTRHAREDGDNIQ